MISGLQCGLTHGGLTQCGLTQCCLTQCGLTHDLHWCGLVLPENKLLDPADKMSQVHGQFVLVLDPACVFIEYQYRLAG